MRLCGIELCGSEAVIALVENDSGTFSHIELATKRVPLADGDCCDTIRLFKETVDSVLRDNKVDRVIIKKRAKKGKFAGGADSFKMEALIQLTPEAQVVLVSPQAMTAAKKAGIEYPQSLNEYQKEAFAAAITGA